MIMDDKKKADILNRLLANTVIMHEMFMGCETDDITLADYGKFFENTVEIVAEVGGIDEVANFRHKFCERVDANNGKTVTVEVIE